MKFIKYVYQYLADNAYPSENIPNNGFLDEKTLLAVSKLHISADFSESSRMKFCFMHYTITNTSLLLKQGLVFLKEEDARPGKCISTPTLMDKINCDTICNLNDKNKTEIMKKSVVFNVKKTSTEELSYSTESFDSNNDVKEKKSKFEFSKI